MKMDELFISINYFYFYFFAKTKFKKKDGNFYIDVFKNLTHEMFFNHTSGHTIY